MSTWNTTKVQTENCCDANSRSYLIPTFQKLVVTLANHTMTTLGIFKDNAKWPQGWYGQQIQRYVFWKWGIHHPNLHAGSSSDSSSHKLFRCPAGQSHMKFCSAVEPYNIIICSSVQEQCRQFSWETPFQFGTKKELPSYVLTKFSLMLMTDSKYSISISDSKSKSHTTLFNFPTSHTSYNPPTTDKNIQEVLTMTLKTNVLVGRQQKWVTLKPSLRSWWNSDISHYPSMTPQQPFTYQLPLLHHRPFLKLNAICWSEFLGFGREIGVSNSAGFTSKKL